MATTASGNPASRNPGAGSTVVDVSASVAGPGCPAKASDVAGSRSAGAAGSVHPGASPSCAGPSCDLGAIRPGLVAGSSDDIDAAAVGGAANVTCVVLLAALTFNLLQHAPTLLA
jgi:hypothetical protein